MNHFCARNLRPLAFVVLLAGSVFAQEFSADMVNARTDGFSSGGKLYVSNQRVRFESDRESAGGGKPIMIMDFAQHTNTMLMPAHHMYVSYPQGRGMTIPIWRLTDVNNACAEWEAFAAQLRTESKVKSCQRTGNDTLNGRSAVKYVITSTDGKVSTVWIDPKLRTLLKREAPDGTIELKNIREGAQSASLFEVPPGYQKMEMPMGMPGSAPH